MTTIAKFQNFSKADIDAIAEMDYEAAKEFSHGLIDRASKSKKPIRQEKCQYLHNSVDRARNVNELLVLFYNMLLSGEGLGSISSRYGKKFA